MLPWRKRFLWSLHLQDTEILLPTEEVPRAPSQPHTRCLPSAHTSSVIIQGTHHVSPGLLHLVLLPQPASSRLTLYSATWMTPLGPLPAQNTCLLPSILSVQSRALCMAHQVLPSPASICLSVSSPQLLPTMPCYKCAP